MKYLSEKTLKKKYDFYRISEEENEELHKYLNCFSNFYGAMDVKSIWDILKLYKVKITKEKFYNFIDIAQREKHNYGIYDLCEVYSGETSTKTKDKILINNELVGYGQSKFWLYYILEDKREDAVSVCVLTKDEFLKHQIDNFWINNDYSVAMVNFISNLKTSGIAKNFMNGLPENQILDLQGKPVVGKKLSEFCFYDRYEQFLFKREKRPFYLEKFKEEHNVSAATRILKSIKDHIMVGRRVEFTQDLKYVLDDIVNDCGVEFSEDDLDSFMFLFMNVNNYSHLWINYGWAPCDLVEKEIDNLDDLELDGKIEKSFNFDDFDRHCKKHNIDVCDDESKRYS